MSKCCDTCTINSSEWFYDGSYNVATGITPSDDGNTVITKLITYIDNSGGLTFTAGSGIGIVRSLNDVTITNTMPSTTQMITISGQVVTLSGGGGSITIPSVGGSQVNSDWAASSGVAQILNKPVIPSNQTLSYNSGTGVLGISAGNSVTIPNLVYVAGSGISISGSTITNTAPNSNQSLSISGNQLSISAGNTVTLPSQSFQTPVYVSAATLNTSATPNADTYILAATTTTINLTAATSEPLGKSLGFKIFGRGSALNFTGGVVKNFATTITSTDVSGNSFIRLVVADNGGGKIWELIQFNQNIV